MAPFGFHGIGGEWFRIDIDSKQLADVARFRDALGPGTLPLLSALFEEAGLQPSFTYNLAVGSTRTAAVFDGATVFMACDDQENA